MSSCIAFAGLTDVVSNAIGMFISAIANGILGMADFILTPLFSITTMKTTDIAAYGSTLTIEQLEQQDENLPERLRRVWTSYVAVRDSAEADNYMKGLMRKKVLSLLAEKHVTVYRVCKDTGINRGRLYRWLNKENMSAISCRGVDKVLRYLDKLPENA